MKKLLRGVADIVAAIVAMTGLIVMLVGLYIASPELVGQIGKAVDDTYGKLHREMERLQKEGI